MGVSNGYDIGVNGRDLILKTSGKIYVKVADKFYELDFRNNKEQKSDSSQSLEVKAPDVVLLDTLSKENYPGDNKLVINNDDLYITKGGFYKKVNDTASSQTEDAVSKTSTTNNLFVRSSNGVWSIGESISTYDVEFVQDPTVKWNDYLFFNTAWDFFFDDLYGKFEEDIFNSIFFNVTNEEPATWVAKSKSEIESTVLPEIYKNGKQVNIHDFKDLYESFWYSEKSFNDEISNYIGSYAIFSINKWTSDIRPKTTITIGEYEVLITAVIGDTVIVKFKDADIAPDLSNIYKTSGAMVICEKNNSVFLDIVNGDINIYNATTQSEDDVRVRIGSLDTLNNHSGVGAFFNGNVTIKNGPFVLNSDGSGQIGTGLCWDKYGNLSGSLIDRITSLEE